MISFRDDIPYAKAIEIEKRQNCIMNNVGLGVLGTAAVYGLVKLGQYWNRRQ